MEEAAGIIGAVSKYPELKASGIASARWVKPGVYEIVIKRWKREDGTSDAPDRVELNRDGAKSMAEGLRKMNEQLQAQVDANNKAIANIDGPLLADMDALDAEAKAAGDL